MRCTTSKAPEGAGLSCTADRVLFARPRHGIAELRAIGACRRRVYRRLRLPHRRNQTRKSPIILRCPSALLHLPALRSVASLIKPLIPDEKPCLHPHRTSRDFAAPANGSNASCNEYICRQQDRSCAAHMLQAQSFACGADQAYGHGLTESPQQLSFTSQETRERFERRLRLSVISHLLASASCPGAQLGCPMRSSFQSPQNI